MSETCKTCSHWTAPHETMKSWQGRCGLMHEEYGYGWENRKDRAYAWGYEPEPCGVWVGPDFGCIHHETADDDD